MLEEGHADVVMEEAEELLVAENVSALLTGTTARLQGCSLLLDGKVVSRRSLSPMTDLNFVEFPAYELLDFSRYQSSYYGKEKVRYATVFTSKGCPYTCGYCPYPFGFGARLIYRAPERVGADIERLNREFGVQQILFRDQVFTINPKHARAICEDLIRRDLGITWVCETRYDLVNPDLLALMKRSGCIEVHYGLESADEEMFAKVAKTDGPKSLDLFQRAIGWAREAGLKVHVHLIVGMPDESVDSIQNTKKWLRRVKPDSVQLAYFVPYPGTPLFSELRVSRELGDVESIDWERLGAFSDPVLPSRHMTISQIRRARDDLAVGWRYSLADRVFNRLRKFAGIAAQ